MAAASDASRKSQRLQQQLVLMRAPPLFPYPKSVKDFYGNKLPAFSRAVQALVKHTSDLLCANSHGGKVAKRIKA